MTPPVHPTDVEPEHAGAPCQLLEWDSTFFGFPIGIVRAIPMSVEDADAVETWAIAHKLRCLYLFADDDDAVTRRVAEGRGFDLVDHRVVYFCDTAPFRDDEPDPAHPIRPAVAADVLALIALARVSHRNTRFYRDSRFPREQSDAMYGRWMERSCEGWADSVLVAGPEGEPFGYVTTHRGAMGIMAIREDHRRQGWARAFVRASLAWSAGQNVASVMFRTQRDNHVARRLYEELGARRDSSSLVYHRWFDSSLG